MKKSVLVFRELPQDQLARISALHDVAVANPRKADRRVVTWLE
jgi:phosphogluconate 2-dehydrogenase